MDLDRIVQAAEEGQLASAPPNGQSPNVVQLMTSTGPQLVPAEVGTYMMVQEVVKELRALNASIAKLAGMIPFRPKGL